MQKSKVKNRIKFVQLAFEDNKKAAKELRKMANGLENTKTIADIYYALSEIFGVSERTIARDSKNDTI